MPARKARRTRPAPSRSASLIFLGATQPRGFALPEIGDAHPDPIVRELLQNSLDAAADAERPAEVHFTLGEAPLDDLPGIEAYRRHFEAAAGEREGVVLSPAERTAIRRIHETLRSGRAELLFCRDNGAGLDPARMTGIVTEIGSRKADGAGSYGVGHFTAFAASGLRYVLYAGRYRDGGDLRTAASGHAILASRSDRGRGADGFWLRSGQTSLLDGATDRDRYPAAAPPLLADELGRVEDSGSVVCIAGFNDFIDDRAETARSILRAAATHFLAAVWRDGMTVRVRDRGGERSVADRAALPSILEAGRDNSRASPGWLSGEKAWRAWEALEYGERLVLAGADVRVRLLGNADPRRDSRVHLFRNGMWITHDVRQLRMDQFRGWRTFDAVVLLDEGELHGLVRAAEGHEHRGIDPKRLADEDDRRRLNELLREIRAGLREHAGRIERTDSFVPQDFAMIRGNEEREAQSMPRARPRPSGGETEKGVTTNGAEGRGRGGTGRRRGGATPRPGTQLRLRSSLRPKLGPGGGIEEIEARWLFPGDRPPGAVGLRISLASGSDRTCDAELRPQWALLREIRGPGGAVLAAADGEDGDTELTIPADAGEMTIRLASPLPAASLPELDVVRRTADGP